MRINRGLSLIFHALGKALFVHQIEDALGRRVTAGKAGRPRKILATS